MQSNDYRFGSEKQQLEIEKNLSFVNWASILTHYSGMGDGLEWR
jgi:hypothetical protein